MNKFLLTIGFLLILAGIFLIGYNSSFWYITQGKANLNSGKIARAAEILLEGLNKHPTNNKISFYLAKSYLQMNEVDKANKIVMKYNIINTANLNNELLDFIVDLTEANQKEGKEKFVETLASAYLKFLENNEASIKTAKNLARIGQLLPSKSIILWEEAYRIAKYFKNQDLMTEIKELLLPKYLDEATSLIEKKKYKKSLHLLDKAFKLGKDSKTNFLKAQILYATGKVKAAYEQFEEAIEQNPDDITYRNEYAKLLKVEAKKTKDPTLKEEYLQKALLLTKEKPKTKNQKLKTKITASDFKIKSINGLPYPSLTFKINHSNVPTTYKVEFFDKNYNEIYKDEADISISESGKVIEVSSKIPTKNENTIHAKLYLNNELINEYTIHKQQEQPNEIRNTRQ